MEKNSIITQQHNHPSSTFDTLRTSRYTEE